MPICGMVRRSGRNTSLTVQSKLPVPRSPATSQLPGTISASERANTPRQYSERLPELQHLKFAQVVVITRPQAPNPEPQSALAETEMREALGEAIARLPEREKLVVTLYYYEELTLREIGEVLGVTESRVSQLHTKAILRLKARLAGSPAREPLNR